MDRRCGVIISLLVLVLTGASRSAELSESNRENIKIAVPLDLPELSWLAATTDRITALTREPVSCLLPARDTVHATQIRAGELVFGSSALLGGQAAKAQMSCSSCHRNGRGNPDFLFAGVSGAAGTADVTSGVFGKLRADDTFNPVAIPDLALPDGQDQVDRHDIAALTAFVHGQIEEEFSGAIPPEPVMVALTTYLKAIDMTACSATENRSISWQDDWDDAIDAIIFSEQAFANDDGPVAKFYVRSARASLARLYARYIADDHADIRSRLVVLSRSIAQSTGKSKQQFASSQSASELKVLLAEQANHSLYNPQVLMTLLGD